MLLELFVLINKDWSILNNIIRLRRSSVYSHLLPHATVLLEADYVSNLGPMMDELSRHHPDLKKNIFHGVHSALKAVIEAGKRPSNATNFRMPRYHTHDEKNTKSSSRLPTDPFWEPSYLPDASASKNDVASSSDDGGILLLIDNLARVSKDIDAVADFISFSTATFKTVTLPRDLVQEEFVLDISHLLTLPTLPYDFARSEACDMLRHCLKLLMDSSTAVSINPILRQMKQAILSSMSVEKEIQHEAAAGHKSIDVSQLSALFDDSTSDTTSHLSQIKLSCLAKILNFVVLLADVYVSPGMGSNRYHAMLFEPLSSNSKIGTEDLLSLMGDFYRWVLVSFYGCLL